MKESFKLEKRQILRNNEYNDTQDMQDNLYKESKENKIFTNLLPLICDKRNVLLAYRNIKNNSGSKTVGTDKLTIEDVEKIGMEEYVKSIQNRLENYKPKSVRRVEIPKENGKTRPLGIPCIWDRLVQQCIKQILNPICEAKFHRHSYGFRENRSCEHAIAMSMRYMNICKMHYVVDVDIKGFFDNVNHAKLKKQLWSLGIQDKNLISIIGKMLRAEIDGIGIPEKGTPQGGIISPLFANVCLNELDWWLSSQWETFETDNDYAFKRKLNGKEIIDKSYMEKVLKKTELKEIRFVRYADDFKIFCRDYKTAEKILKAVTMWLKERLGLDISPEKSKITNLRKNYTEFLGFKMKVFLKGVGKKRKNLLLKQKKKIPKMKYVCQSYMSEKSKKRTIKKLKEQVVRIQKKPVMSEIIKLNSKILGIHNYFRIATMVNLDCGEINFLVERTIYNRLRTVLKYNRKYSESYKELYKDYCKRKVWNFKEYTIYPISGLKTANPMCFSQDICNYTKESRLKNHTNIGKYTELLIKDYISRGNEYQDLKLWDNSISLISGQNVCCGVTGETLQIGNMELHHRKPRKLGGTNDYKNLVWLTYEAHKLIHCTEQDTINKYMEILKLDKKQLKKVNNLRKLVENLVI